MNNLLYLDALNEEQKKAVCHEGQSLLILAGAGSGKTRVITTKIAWLIQERGISPESILAVTFTNKAAREMAERARALTVQTEQTILRTFHSFGALLLRRYGSLINISNQFNIYDDEDAVSLLISSDNSIDKQYARKIIKKISRAKNYCLTSDSPQLSRIDSDPEFARLYAIYQKRLAETGNVDFGDLIMLPVKILKTFPDVAKKLHNRFSVILVDEYQDSNSAQFEFLQALTGPQTYLCVVGDDDQSIYRFRGAEVKNILTFADFFPDTDIIRLEKNYRSYREILDVANAVIDKNTGRLGKKLFAARGSGKKPSLYYLPNQNLESELCAQLIKQAVQNGGAYSDWAILYRTNAQSLNFETQFIQKKIPHRVIGSVKFYNREEIKDSLALLALIANGRDEVALRRIINKPPRGIGSITKERIIGAARTVFFSAQNDSLDFEESFDFITYISALIPKLSLQKKTAASLQEFLGLLTRVRRELQTEVPTENTSAEGLAALILTIIEHAGLKAYYHAQDEISDTQRESNLNELANAAALYPFSFAGLTSFLEHIELNKTLEDEQKDFDAVNLITIHNTKGLEFKQVIITGLETGIFPREKLAPDEMEEERRLMYVACTRAQNELYMTSCASRRLFGRTQAMTPAPFLYEIDPSLLTIIADNSTAIPQKFHTPNNRSAIGQTVYHDDFGYGGIINEKTTGGETVWIIQFETGMIKRFMPEYQRNELLFVSE